MYPDPVLFGRIIVILLLAAVLGVIAATFFVLPLILSRIGQVSKKLSKIIEYLEKKQA